MPTRAIPAPLLAPTYRRPQKQSLCSQNANTRAYPLFAGTSYPLGTSAYLPFDQTEICSPKSASQAQVKPCKRLHINVDYPSGKALDQARALEWNQHRAMNYAIF